MAYVNVGLIEPGRVLASAVFRTASMPLSCECFIFPVAQVCYVIKVGETLPVWPNTDAYGAGSLVKGRNTFTNAMLLARVSLIPGQRRSRVNDTAV